MCPGLVFAGCLWSWDTESPRRWAHRKDPYLGPSSPLPRPLIWFVSSRNWRNPPSASPTPGQKFAAVQHLGKSSPIPLFTYGRLNWARSSGLRSGVGAFGKGEPRRPTCIVSFPSASPHPTRFGSCRDAGKGPPTPVSETDLSTAT